MDRLLRTHAQLLAFGLRVRVGQDLRPARRGARARDGRYREAVSTSEPVRFNGHPGYRVRVRASFSGRFVNIVTARGRLDQRATFFRPDGSVLAACVRHITYTATLP